MTEYVTPMISSVLKKYQNSATKSLQGPAVALIKKEILSSPEPHELHHQHPHEANSTGQQLVNSERSQIYAAPLPLPPELSQPILSQPDSGCGELYETRLEGKTIGCFSLGGEMRLCLPQFLNNVLNDFTLEQINRIFDELGIYCSQCTPDQLVEFKAAKILPSDVKASGLITRTDAERLCAALLHRSDRNSYVPVESLAKGALSFQVYHKCFGKCEGICTPDMYSYQKPTCIKCLECEGWFSPQKFVGHVHRKFENRTCHWGFDSRNWHDYLHVALDVENREKYQRILDQLKEVEIKEMHKAQCELDHKKRKYNDNHDDNDDDDNNDYVVGHCTLSHTLSELFTSDFLVSFPMFSLANVSVRRSSHISSTPFPSPQTSLVVAPDSLHLAQVTVYDDGDLLHWLFLSLFLHLYLGLKLV
ncbi:hypothetical protein ACLKA7_003883 [Drosophila subpalustris]